MDFAAIFTGLGGVWGGFWEGFGRTWRVEIVVFLDRVCLFLRFFSFFFFHSYCFKIVCPALSGPALALQVFARAAERRLGDFNVQNLANTAWAFATLGQADVQLFMALAREAGRRVGDFNPQELANTAWAFATLEHVHAQLFMALAREAERRVADFSP